MAHFIVLGRWTEQGIRGIKEIGQRISAVRKMVQEAGGSIQTFYTMGKFDFVSIVELPSDEAANRLLLDVGRQGNIRTATLKAWTESEFSKTVAQLR